MMKRFLFLVLFLIAIPAHADVIMPYYSDPFYYGFGFSWLEARLDKYQTEPTTFDITAGYRLGDSISLEARAGWSGNVGSVSVDNSATVTVDPVFPGYTNIETRYSGILGRYDIRRGAQKLYGLFGVMDVTIDTARATFADTIDVSDTGIAYGFGMQFGKRNSITAEFIKGAGTLNEVTWYRLGVLTHF